MNRFELALQIYEKLNHNAAIDGEDSEIQAGYLIDQSHSRLPVDTWGLAAYIHSIQPLPSYTILLGICQDGLPLLLDLEHYPTGSILITGSHSAAIREFLNSILRSGHLINPPHLLKYCTITPNASAFGNQLLHSSPTAIRHPADRSAHDLIMRLSALVEQRNTGRQRGPTVILAIEDLDTLIRYMDQDVYAHFLWLLREGPFARVWPITTLHAGSRLFTDFQFEALFDTRILVSNFNSPGQGLAHPGMSQSLQPVFHQVITAEHKFNITLPQP